MLLLFIADRNGSFFCLDCFFPVQWSEKCGSLEHIIEEYLYYDRQKLVVEMKDPYMTYMERENPEHLSPILDRIEDMHGKKYCMSSVEASDILTIARI